jgi:hypothetical protein
MFFMVLYSMELLAVLCSELFFVLGCIFLEINTYLFAVLLLSPLLGCIFHIIHSFRLISASTPAPAPAPAKARRGHVPGSPLQGPPHRSGHTRTRQRWLATTAPGAPPAPALPPRQHTAKTATQLGPGHGRRLVLLLPQAGPRRPRLHQQDPVPTLPPLRPQLSRLHARAQSLRPRAGPSG